jgi:pimeloyl-ACP methyl ester carboxylesterase
MGINRMGTNKLEGAGCSGVIGDGVPYIRGGSGPREAVVFFGVNALFKPLDRIPKPERYARQVSRLLPGCRFIILGYAGSTFDEVVRNMASAVRVLPTRPHLVVGISLGGFVAMRFAAEYPELVERLVLLVSAHRFSPGGWRMMERQFAALERADFDTLLRENALLFRRPWYNWLIRLKLWKDGARVFSGFRAPAAILHDYRQLFGPEFQNNADYARRIARPTLVIGGTADQLFDREALEETAALIPGARIRLLERETHMAPVEQSRAVAGAIADFLSR